MDFHNHFNTNRAEAERWLSTAVKLLTTRDLHGTKSFAIRARESDPRLEATEQIIAVADTLLAGESRINNNQLDWYSILQLAHQTQSLELVATQYRRLALLLNPHRNRFPYADQAFRLVSEAWNVLGNPSRKALYDHELNMFSSSARFDSPSGSTQLFERQFLQMHHVQQQPPPQPPPPPPPQQQPPPPLLQRPQPLLPPMTQPLLQPQQQEVQQRQQQQMHQQQQEHRQQQLHQQQEQRQQQLHQQQELRQQQLHQQEQREQQPQPPPQQQQPVRKSPRKEARVVVEEERPSPNNNVTESTPPPPSELPRPSQSARPSKSTPTPPTRRQSESESESFWTACPYCYNLFEYPRVYEECMLRCQNCKRAFNAVVIASPPVTGDATFCCWGYIPLGFSGTGKDTSGSSGWTPFSTMFACPLQEKKSVGRGKNANSGPRVYYDDEAVLLEPLDSSEDSDDDWQRDSRTKKRAVRAKGRGSGAKNPVRASERIRKGSQSVGGQGKAGSGGASGGGSASKAESSKRTSGSARKRGAAELGKLDLNVEFSNHEGEEPAAQTMSEGNGTANGEEDNIEGIEFFEGLDEFLSNLPILNVVGDDKVKAN